MTIRTGVLNFEVSHTHNVPGVSFVLIIDPATPLEQADLSGRVPTSLVAGVKAVSAARSAHQYIVHRFNSLRYTGLLLTHTKSNTSCPRSSNPRWQCRAYFLVT